MIDFVFMMLVVSDRAIVPLYLIDGVVAFTCGEIEKVPNFVWYQKRVLEIGHLRQAGQRL